MTTPTPFPVTAARAAALVQATLSLVAGGLTSLFTAATYVSDRADAAAGHPNEWAGLGEYIGVILAGLFVGAALLVGLPALLLRPHRPGPRILLVLGEIVTAVPVAATALADAHRRPQQPWVVVLALYLALAVVTVWLLLEAPARAWSADHPAAARRAPARPDDVVVR